MESPRLKKLNKSLTTMITQFLQCCQLGQLTVIFKNAVAEIAIFGASHIFIKDTRC